MNKITKEKQLTVYIEAFENFKATIAALEVSGLSRKMMVTLGKHHIRRTEGKLELLAGDQPKGGE